MTWSACVSHRNFVPSSSLRARKLWPHKALPRWSMSTSQAVPFNIAEQVPRDLCGIFWDFDNEYVTAARLTTKLGIVQGVAGKHSCSVHTFNIYFNPATRKGISRQSCKDFERAGAQLIPVDLRSEAADLAISSDAYHFCQQHREKACIILLSADHGFAGLLAYLRSLGCLTIVIGRFSVTPRVKANPGMWRKLPLPSSADLAFEWTDLD